MILIKLSYGLSGHFLLYGDSHQRRISKSYPIRLRMRQDGIDLLARDESASDNPIAGHILTRFRRDSLHGKSLLNFTNPGIDSTPFTPEAWEDGFHELFLRDDRELNVAGSEGAVVAALDHALRVRVSCEFNIAGRLSFTGHPVRISVIWLR
jgi:hypothetical protein